VAALPWLCAVFIGLSRYVDYMHHWTDIATGLALGGVIAWAAFQQQAPRLAEGDALSLQGARHSEPEAQSLVSMPL
jgi:membrane-associated phospholipid phosphatase